MRKRYFVTATFLASTFLAACTPSDGVNSLDGLTTSTATDGSHARPVNLNYPLQTRFLAVNGQLPVPGIGSACLASSRRPANSIICFSQDGHTNVLRREYDYTGGPGTLADIAKNLAALKLKVLKLEVLKLEAKTTPPDEKANVDSLVSAAAVNVANMAETLSGEMTTANVFVFRWSANQNGNASGTAGTFAGASASGQSSNSGMVIVGGLRMSQLLLGSTQDFDEVTAAYPQRAKIATLTMEAKNILYIADGSSSAAIQAALKGSLDQAKNTNISTAALSANAYAAIANAQDNRGAFDSPSAVDLRKFEAPNLGGQEGKWMTFYATMTEIESLKKAAKRNE